MEWTSDGRLLVSEHSAGRVKDVTSGGDMRDVEPFAYGLNGPAGILCSSDGTILIAESWGGNVKDISGGGDASGSKPFSSGLSIPYSLCHVQKGDGTVHIYVSESDDSRESWISDITDGGERDESDKYIVDIPVVHGAPGVTPLNSWPNNWENFAATGCVKNWQDQSGPTGITSNHFIAIGGLGQIIDASAGGGAYIDLIRDNKLIAWGLSGLGGMKIHPTNGLIYAVEPAKGNIVVVNPANPKNYVFESPLIRGLIWPTCIRFSSDGATMYVCSQGNGVIWQITDFL